MIIETEIVAECEICKSPLIVHWFKAYMPFSYNNNYVTVKVRVTPCATCMDTTKEEGTSNVS